MRTLLLLVTTVAACSTNPLTFPSAPDADVLATPQCPLSLDSICNDVSCEVMGESYPATLDGWCGYGTLDNTPVSTAGESACNGWRLVSAPDGDQSLSFFYDASGAIVAITRWGSAPPCEGACVMSCISAPPNVDLTTLASCIADSQLSCGG